MKDKKGAFSRILSRVKKDNKIFVDLNLSIAEQVRHSLAHHPEIRTQKALAVKLDKEESEISKWLTGLHNLTLDSLVKIMAALDEELFMTDLRAKEKYGYHATRHIEERVIEQMTAQFVQISLSKDSTMSISKTIEGTVSSSMKTSVPIIPSKASA